MPEQPLWGASVGGTDIRAYYRAVYSHAPADSAADDGHQRWELCITRNDALYYFEKFTDEGALQKRSLELFLTLSRNGWSSLGSQKRTRLTTDHRIKQPACATTRTHHNLDRMPVISPRHLRAEIRRFRKAE